MSSVGKKSVQYQRPQLYQRPQFYLQSCLDMISVIRTYNNLLPLKLFYSDSETHMHCNHL